MSFCGYRWHLRLWRSASSASPAPSAPSAAGVAAFGGFCALQMPSKGPDASGSPVSKAVDSESKRFFVQVASALMSWRDCSSQVVTQCLRSFLGGAPNGGVPYGFPLPAPTHQTDSSATPSENQRRQLTFSSFSHSPPRRQTGKCWQERFSPANTATQPQASKAP